ncbi:hypothetical protein FVEG_04314 [Fusarium verticillioides 7600]|uniref:Cytochrome P450 oxidoreductase n=1 Tax=Gibberella moniliformis (strain M3125 / FGSC 7600) TaxID=334819 RepID=W7LTK3_GIBM7|nr:hypothetical protein FVEG_04314 [Fusarium verticillioides 7600]EWG42538.1 hypothetical protein FVEG_04314 [Fusarium verticillioides 7600]
MRTGPRRQNKTVKQQGSRSEVGRHEGERTAVSDPGVMSIDDNLISYGESQLHLEDSAVGITDSAISPLSMNQDITVLTDQAPVAMQHSTTSPSPSSVDRNLDDSHAPEPASPATNETSDDAGISHQNNTNLAAYSAEVSDLQNHITVAFASSSAETEATVLPTHCAPGDFFVDDTIADSWLPLEDSNDEEASGVRITAGSESINHILSRISDTPTLPSSIPDPFDDYLFCHYMQNLSLCLYPMRPDCNPYRDIYGDLAVSSRSLRSTILFASASHLVNLGRLPKFALQPYRKAMRVAFREGIAIETELEGLAATALLSVVFDVIDTGLDTWSTRLLGCRRLLKNATDKSNGTSGRFLQCMVVQYNWAATMSRTLLRDVVSQEILDEIGTVIHVPGSDTKAGRKQGARIQSLWWHNLPDHAMHLMFREVTDLAAQVHQMKTSRKSVDDTLKLMAHAGELVRRLENWTPDVSMVDQEHTDSVQHFNAIWQLGLLCFIHQEIYTLDSSDTRIQKLWSRIGNFQGRKSERIHEAHVRYGSVVRVGPNKLSFSTPTAVQAIYTSNDFTKEESFYRAKRIFHENHLFSFRDAEAHKTRRKNFSRGFSQSSMLDFEPHVSSKIKALLNQWATRANDGPIDVYPWCHWLGFDVIYHLMFDEDPGSVPRGQPHQVMRYIKAWKPTYIYKEFLPQMEQYGVYVPGTIGGYFRDVRTWKKYALKLIEEIRQKDSHTPFLRNVLSAEKSGDAAQPLTNSELAEECMGGMFGGSGTTANTFVYILWACLKQPNVVAKLRSELLQAFPEPGLVPDYQTCSKLPYLQAVINETLRRYPTIVARSPRTANNDTVIDGIPVPKGTIVGTQNFTMHRNEDAFPSPEDFIPERWLAADGKETLKASWTPFSVGSRRCIGINLAQMELSKLTAAFFLRFDARVDEAMTEEDMRMYDTSNAGPAGARLFVHMREV